MGLILPMGFGSGFQFLGLFGIDIPGVCYLFQMWSIGFYFVRGVIHLTFSRGYCFLPHKGPPLILFYRYCHL